MDAGAALPRGFSAHCDGFVHCRLVARTHLPRARRRDLVAPHTAFFRTLAASSACARGLCTRVRLGTHALRADLQRAGLCADRAGCAAVCRIDAGLRRGYPAGHAGRELCRRPCQRNTEESWLQDYCGSTDDRRGFMDTLPNLCSRWPPAGAGNRAGWRHSGPVEPFPTWLTAAATQVAAAQDQNLKAIPMLYTQGLISTSKLTVPTSVTTSAVVSMSMYQTPAFSIQFLLSGISTPAWAAAPKESSRSSRDEPAPM